MFAIDFSAAFMIASDISLTSLKFLSIYFCHFQSFQKYSIHLIGAFYIVRNQPVGNSIFVFYKQVYEGCPRKS